MIFQTYLTSARFFCGTCSDDFTAVFHFTIKTVGSRDQCEFIQNCGPTKMRVTTLIISCLYRNLPWNGRWCGFTSYNFSRIKSICVCHKVWHGCWKKEYVMDILSIGIHSQESKKVKMVKTALTQNCFAIFLKSYYVLSFMLCDSYHNLYIGLQPFLEEGTLW